jgi:hypothetical protein
VLAVAALNLTAGCGESAEHEASGRANSGGHSSAAGRDSSGSGATDSAGLGSMNGGTSGKAGSRGTRATGAVGGGGSSGLAGEAGEGGELTTSGNGGSSGSSGHAGRGGSGGSILIGTGGTSSCGSSLVSVTAPAVDLYLMLDRSGSMLDPSGDTSPSTKWTVITAALGEFFQAPGSADINLALGYFPEELPVVDECSSDTDCGAAGPCVLHVCEQMPGTMVSCTPSTDPADLAPCTNAVLADDGPCRSGACRLSDRACASDEECITRAAGSLGRCLDFGACEADPTLSCAVAHSGVSQPGCGANGSSGLCVAASYSFCQHPTQCDPDVYAAPSIDFVGLPGNASLLDGSLAEQKPSGDTPTRAALRGAITAARRRAATYPADAVAVVLATDGLPTGCDAGREIAAETSAAVDAAVATAQAGFAPPNGTPAVPTYVVGVLGADASALNNLDRIAAAGGTKAAHLVQEGSDFQHDISAALAAIAQQVSRCELTISNESGRPLGDDQFTVTLSSGALTRVGPTACTGASNEWHFDVDPSTGTPSRLVLCPNTCAALEASTNPDLRVLIGCSPAQP